MTAPQERPVAGDGLDREAVRRLSESVNGYFHDDRQVDVTVAEAGAILLAREVPALLAALRAAEAEVERLREYVAHLTHNRTEHIGRVVRRTEGGASCDHVWHAEQDRYCAKGCGAQMPADTEGGAS